MFDDHFEVFLADTDESKEIHYSIRYQVYCEEMGFENKDDFPLKQEVDEYDNNSKHFIVRTRLTEQWVGAMRIVFNTDQLLPIEKHCVLNETIVKNNLGQSVELSRLCLIKEIRRRFNDVPPYGITDDRKEIKKIDKVLLLKNRRINHSIIWGLLNAATEYCYANDIENWYFITTTALEKVLRKGGFNMFNIGEPCYHNGKRYPFKKDVVDTYHNETWRNNLKNGYRRFSELDLPEVMANVA